MDSDAWAGIAQIILEGFDRHYALFRKYSQAGRECFESADWNRSADLNLKRISGYEERVRETVDIVLERFPEAAVKTESWPRVKVAFTGKLMNHWQAECAETFYNSVACRVLHRDYYKTEYIFWRPAISTEYLEASQPTYLSHYPGKDGLRRSLLEILSSTGPAVPFQNLRRDLRFLERAMLERRGNDWHEEPNFQIQVLHSPFYRNKAAYIVGRMINGTKRTPFVIPLIRNDDGTMTVDCLLTRPRNVAILFSFSRAYFMVDMEVPSAYVRFLTSIMPRKSPVDLYAMLGLQKQAKTIFYRQLQHHLRHSRDNFVVAPGVRGMVMLVFCLPSFPFVFKMIKDRFDPPKTSSAREVRAKYTLVKNHDRVGRLADTLEYSNVAVPLDRIDPELLQQLRENCAETIEESGDRLIIGHCYIERRMEPLDNYLSRASGADREHVIQDYGNSIRDLAGANIFPGDMLKKNFGVTRHQRVVFYDYDEIAYITECNFRRIPPARDYDDMMSDEPWYSVEENDVFPETFGPFFFAEKADMEEFKKHHAELMTAQWWKDVKDGILAGKRADIYPYPEKYRFCNRFA